MVVHGECNPVPVHATAQFFYLVVDDAAIFFFPFKSMFKELFAAQCVFVNAFFTKHLNYLGFGGNACMVAAGYPTGIETAHSCLAYKNVLHSLVEGVAHVQHTCHIGRWNDNSVCWPSIGFAGEVAFGFPVFRPFMFRFRRDIIFA